MRETVAIYSPKEKIKPATENQQQLIEQLLNAFPDGKETHEYDDYKINPTKENASELIAELIERNFDRITDREIFIKYLAERPGVEKSESTDCFPTAMMKLFYHKHRKILRSIPEMCGLMLFR